MKKAKGERMLLRFENKDYHHFDKDWHVTFKNMLLKTSEKEASECIKPIWCC